MEPIVNLDFATLYPGVQKAYNIKIPHLRAMLRKNKIKKIFNL